MKVIHANREEMLFDSAYFGDIIEYSGDYYMKILALKNGDNAVNVYDGHTIKINDGETVLSVDCELVIK